ncbi:MAG: cell division protein FtsL [Parvibaculales bacterium]
MIRLLNTLCVICFIALTLAVYHIRYSAEAEARQLRRLEIRIGEELEQRRVLEAEWSSLNDPQRLQYLAGKYLDLQVARASQYVEENEEAITSVPVLLRAEGGVRGAR